MLLTKFNSGPAEKRAKVAILAVKSHRKLSGSEHLLDGVVSGVVDEGKFKVTQLGRFGCRCLLSAYSAGPEYGT